MTEALRDAAAALGAISDAPRFEAEHLMAKALGTSRERVLLAHMRDDAPVDFPALLDRRLAREPLQYILGEAPFWTIALLVGPGVLIPRSDSETLIEAAIAHFGDRAPRRILDLGTGPGTLLLAALSHWRQATGLGIDASDVALDYARRNAGKLDLDDRVTLHRGDWAAGIDERFDLILCNPPYVETQAALQPEVRAHEPPGALFAGSEGLDDYARIIPQLPALIAPGGAAILELGAGQAGAVGALAQAAGLAWSTRYDLAGVARAMTLLCRG